METSKHIEASITKAEREAQEYDLVVNRARSRSKSAADLFERSEGKPAQPTAPSCNLKKCVTAMMLTNFLTPFDTQQYTPSMPLLVRDQMGASITVLGYVFFTLTFCVLVAFIAMAPLLKRMSIRSLLLGNFFIRIFGGVAYVMGASGAGSMFYIFLSRVLYGITLNSFAAPFAWVACRLPAENRPTAIFGLQALLSTGIIFGPSWGAFLMATFGFASSGYFTVVSAAVQWAIIFSMVDDTELLPSGHAAGAKKEEDPEAARRRKVVLGCIAFNGFCLCMGLLAGFEALMSMAVKDSYGWGADQQWRAWVPFGIASLGSFVTIPIFQQVFNFAKCALWMNVGGLVGLIAINWGDLSQPVPTWLWYISMVNVMFQSVAYVVHPTILALRMAPEQQVAASALVQVAGQVGRTLAPVMATQIYKYFTEIYGIGSGLNVALLFMTFWALLGNGVPLLFFNDVYGSFDEPSKAELMAAKKKEESQKMMM